MGIVTMAAFMGSVEDLESEYAFGEGAKEAQMVLDSVCVDLRYEYLAVSARSGRYPGYL